MRGPSGQGLWCCSWQHPPTASSLAGDFPAVCGSRSSRDNAVPRVSSFLQLRDFPKQWDERLTAFFCACQVNKTHCLVVPPHLSCSLLKTCRQGEAPPSDVWTCVASLQLRLQVVISCRCCCLSPPVALLYLTRAPQLQAVVLVQLSALREASDCNFLKCLFFLVLRTECGRRFLVNCKKLLHMLNCIALLLCAQMMVLLCFCSDFTHFVLQTAVAFGPQYMRMTCHPCAIVSS